MQRKIKKKLRTAQVSRSKQIFFEHGLGGWAVNGQQSTVNSQRDKETKRQRVKETKGLRVEELKGVFYVFLSLRVFSLV